jgi:hypothetical protein
MIVGLLALGVSASLPSYNRKACQRPGNVELRGCPKNTLVVGPSGHFASIQQAILSLPENSDSYVVLIQPGNYTEQLNITRPGPLTLLGVTASPNDKAGNQVNVIWHNATGTATTGTYDNAYTSTLTIAPTLNSSFTGTGPTGFAVPADTPFGNSDFRTYNLNFINDYLPYAAGPSLALSLSYANGGFYYTRFLSYQDTVRHVTSHPHYHPLTASLPGLHRQTRQRIHVRLRSRRPDRFLLRLWNLLGDEVCRYASRLRWRHYGLERHEYYFRKQVRCLHPPLRCGES